jgi:hypothetical protein
MHLRARYNVAGKLERGESVSAVGGSLNPDSGTRGHFGKALGKGGLAPLQVVGKSELLA